MGRIRPLVWQKSPKLLGVEVADSPIGRFCAFKTGFTRTFPGITVEDVDGATSLEQSKEMAEARYREIIASVFEEES